MLYNRQKLLMALINALNKKGLCSRLYLVKTLFLLKQKFDNISYDFFPYKFGPFSQTMYEDLTYLVANNYLNSNEKELTLEGQNALFAEPELLNEIENITNLFSNQNEIKEFVYKNYPEYTIKSNDSRMELKVPSVGRFTIGYEGKSIDSFLNTLIQNNISVLVDVRKNALSMKRGFSKAQLQKHLERIGVRYEHIPELGIESSKRKNLNTKIDYDALFVEYQKALPSKKIGLDKLRNLSLKEKIAIMCFEKDHNFCHRGQISSFIGGFEHL